MHGFVYRNTKCTVPNWQSLHQTQPRGMAYETENLFVHMFGVERGLWIVSRGLTVTDKRDGSLFDWIKQTFGATEIEKSDLDVGATIWGTWRPGLFDYDELSQGLGWSNSELRFAEQSLLVLVQKLEELLLFVEPTFSNDGYP